MRSITGDRCGGLRFSGASVFRRSQRGRWLSFGFDRPPVLPLIERLYVDKAPFSVDNLPALWTKQASALWSPWTESTLVWLSWAPAVFSSTLATACVRNS